MFRTERQITVRMVDTHEGRGWSNFGAVGVKPADTSAPVPVAVPTGPGQGHASLVPAAVIARRGAIPLTRGGLLGNPLHSWGARYIGAGNPMGRRNPRGGGLRAAGIKPCSSSAAPQECEASREACEGVPQSSRKAHPSGPALRSGGRSCDTLLVHALPGADQPAGGWVPRGAGRRGRALWCLSSDPDRYFVPMRSPVDLFDVGAPTWPDHRNWGDDSSPNPRPNAPSAAAKPRRSSTSRRC